MAFIAPTPSIPELTVTDKRIFDVLNALKEHAEHPPLVQPLGCGMMADETEKGGVEIEKVKDIAGYHAVT